MADNVTLNSGSGGAVAATDDIAGVHYQRVKLTWGVDGTADDVNASTPLPVTAVSTALTPGTGASNLGKAEDAAHASGDVGVLALAVRRDTPVVGSSTDGDNSTLNVDGNGRLYVNVHDGGNSLTVDGTVAVSGTVTVDASGTTVPVSNAALTELAAAINVSSQLDVNIAASGATVPVSNAGITTIAGAVSGTEMQVDVITMPTVTVNSHNVTNAGTFAVQAAQSGSWTVDLGATDNAVLDTIASPVATIGTTPLQRVAIFDASNAQITSFGGGTQYTEDAAAAADPVGTAPILVRADTPAAITSANGDNVAQRGTNYGAAYVQVVSSSGAFIDSFGGSGGTAMVDDAAFTPGSTSVTPMGAMFDDVTPDSVNEGDGGVVRMSANRNLYVTIRDAAGNERGLNIDAAGALSVASHAVTNAGTFAVQVDGAALTALQLIDNIVLAEDAAHVSGDPGVQLLAVRTDTPAARSGADGDYEPLQISAGRLWTSTTVTSLPASTNTLEVVGDVAHDAAAAGNPVLVGAYASATAPTAVSANGDAVRLWATTSGALNVADGGGSITVDNAGTFAVQATLQASTNTQEVVGDAADDAATAGNPVLIGGVAVETDGTDPTTVSAEGDAAYLRTDRARRLLVNKSHPRGFFTSADYASAQTNATVQAAPGAGLSLYITDIIISNGATAGNITLLDGSGGTVKFEIYPAINGGVSISLNQPIRLTANTALCITSTTVTTHSVNVGGYIAP